MYVEHRARLAVLKSVIDCLCANSGLAASALPASFLNAIRELRDRPQFPR